MSTEVLRLACNRYHITSTGSREVLATRLHQFFNPITVNASISPATEETPLVGATAADPNNNTVEVENGRLGLPIPDISALVRDEVQRILGSIAMQPTIPPTTSSSIYGPKSRAAEEITREL